MTSLYNFIEADRRGKFSSFVVLEAATNIGIENFKEAETGYVDSERMEVEMKINGIEVDFEYVMGLIDDQIEDFREKVYCEEKAKVAFDIEQDILRITGRYKGEE